MNKKQLVLATKNKHKIKELSSILAPLDCEILTCEDIGDYDEIEETGNTFQENALLKGRALAEKTGKLTLADDSGLEIDFLNGFPGVISARFAGEGASFEEKNLKILALLKGVPAEMRTARFVCAAALVWPGERSELFVGVCEGQISFVPSGENGFGYDPIFYIPSRGVTMAELPALVKNQISHRAQAFKKIVAFLDKDF